MGVEVRRPLNSKLRVVTDVKGNEYVLFFGDTATYLIPYNRYLYWEHHSVDKSKWISINSIDYSGFNFTKKQYLEAKAELERNIDKITKKFYASL